MRNLSEQDRRKMAAVLARLESDFDGEVLAATHMAASMLRKCGLSWTDILAPASAAEQRPGARKAGGWRSLVVSTLQYPGLLSEWERSFLQSLLPCRHISPKQREKLEQIANQLRNRRAA